MAQESGQNPDKLFLFVHGGFAALLLGGKQIIPSRDLGRHNVVVTRGRSGIGSPPRFHKILAIEPTMVAHPGSTDVPQTCVGVRKCLVVPRIEPALRKRKTVFPGRPRPRGWFFPTLFGIRHEDGRAGEISFLHFVRDLHDSGAAVETLAPVRVTQQTIDCPASGAGPGFFAFLKLDMQGKDFIKPC